MIVLIPQSDDKCLCLYLLALCRISDSVWSPSTAVHAVWYDTGSFCNAAVSLFWHTLLSKILLLCLFMFISTSTMSNI